MITAAPRAGDWPKRHQEFVEQAKRGGIDVLFLGDSLTDGWRTTGIEPWNQHFAPLRAANFGLWGDAAENLLWRMERGELEDLTPRAAVLLIGTNNIPWDPPRTGTSAIPDEVVAAIAQVVGYACGRLPGTRLVLMGLFPRGTPQDFSRELIREVNAGLARLDDGDRVHFLDVGHRFLEGDVIPARLMPDLLHLSAEGYAAWAEELAPFLGKLLA